jgi:hypothetical protein
MGFEESRVSSRLENKTTTTTKTRPIERKIEGT